MGLLPDRLKLSFRRPSSLPPTPSPPPEFLCSISGELMADPVIIPSGETFERACIQALRDNSLSSSPSSSSSSSSFLLIPNSALRSAIIRWCDLAGVPHPIPISSSAASRLALKSPPSSSTPKSHTNCSTKSPNENTPSSSSSDHSSSSSSSEIIADPFENIIAKLKTARIDDLDETLTSILESSRESASRRVALCSPRLLAALRGFLLSHRPSIRSTALAVIVNLSLEPQNKIRIVRSGAVPAIIDALQSSSRNNAAGALFSLALEEQNRTPIGVLGAIPPLIGLFCDSNEDFQTRVESGMAILYLGFSEMNMVKIGRINGIVKCLIGVVKEGEMELRRIAMRLMVGMVGNKEGKSVMLDGGAMEAMLQFLNEEEEGEMAVAILYGMSMAGLRFRGIARRVGAEEVLRRFAESFEGEKKEMAMMTIRVLRGEEREKERDVARVLWADAGEEDDVVEEMMVARRRLNRDLGGGSG